MFPFEMKKLVRKIRGSARRIAPPRPATRLWLEVLEDRTLPSVSTLPVSVASPPAAPQNATVTSFVDSMTARWNNLMATLQQDVFASYQALGQQIAQEASAVELQWDHLFGISPSAANPSSGTAVSQLATHGATTTGHEPAQAPHSSGTTTVHQSAQGLNSIHMSTDTAPGGPNVVGVSGYLWDPPNPANDDNASTPGNWWYDGNQRATNKPGDNPGDTITFDPGNGLIQDGNGNANINWGYNATNPLGSMAVGGTKPYTGLQTIQSGIKVELKGVDRLGQPTASLIMNVNDTVSSLNLQFSSTTSVFQIDNNATFTNFQFTVAPGGSPGEVVIAGGNSYAGGGGAYTETTQVKIRLLGGGSLTLEPGPTGTTPVVLQSGGEIWVDNGGALTLNDNYFNGVIFVKGDGGGGIGQNHERIFVSPQGTVDFYGGENNGVGDVDALYVPVVNEGTFNLFGSTPGADVNHATALLVYGSDSYTSNVSFDQEGWSSTWLANTDLSGGVQLYADQGFRETAPVVGSSSFLSDQDSNPEYLAAGGAGIYVGQYSSIRFTHYGSTFGAFTLFGNVTMNGLLQVNIDGTQSGANDVLNVNNGTMAWNPGSSISVYIYGSQLVTGLNWVIIDASYKLTGMNNITVTPNTLTLDGAAWAKGFGQLDS